MQYRACPNTLPFVCCIPIAVHPQLYVIPRPLNGSLTVREGRSARVECVAAGPGQKGSLAVTELRGPSKRPHGIFILKRPHEIFILVMIGAF